jgi:hypothetical protein
LSFPENHFPEDYRKERSAMSEEAHVAQSPENHFTEEDLIQFDADDAEMGQVICKMLSMLFIYTVIAMSICGAVTFWKIMD